ncbi:hypothetical protein QFW77_01775 [Luteimonas sp. RD2P54]|uniref:XAC0095-like domain-containing protein n=1 Tax=Luteimonas endophytica TaxID=3042023 RepID=A0ABT6J4G9_9GAMM|nr:hypothetical protein [Luteimonas endophytica]MDH5821724.1 hypothetical protein [Luteimonas endophytica]
MSKHDLEEMGTTGYFLAEDSQFRLKKLQDYMMFLSQLAQPRSSEEEHPWGPGPDIRTADLEICLELLAEQVQIVLDEVSWPAERVPKAAGSTKQAEAAEDADEADETEAGGMEVSGEDAVPEDPDTAAQRYVFGITGDQFDTLDRLVQTISAHSDMVASTNAADLASGTVSLVGQAIFDGMETVRAILDAVEAQSLGRLGDRTGVGEERAVYGTPIGRPMLPHSRVTEERPSYGEVVARRTTRREAWRVGPGLMPVAASQVACVLH